VVRFACLLSVAHCHLGTLSITCRLSGCAYQFTLHSDIDDCVQHMIFTFFCHKNLEFGQYLEAQSAAATRFQRSVIHPLMTTN